MKLLPIIALLGTSLAVHLKSGNPGTFPASKAEPPTKHYWSKDKGAGDDLPYCGVFNDLKYGGKCIDSATHQVIVIHYPSDKQPLPENISSSNR